MLAIKLKSLRRGPMSDRPFRYLLAAFVGVQIMTAIVIVVHFLA